VTGALDSHGYPGGKHHQTIWEPTSELTLYFWVISFTKNAKNAKAKSLNVIEKPVLASLDGAVSGLQMVVAWVKLRL